MNKFDIVPTAIGSMALAIVLGLIVAITFLPKAVMIGIIVLIAVAAFFYLSRLVGAVLLLFLMKP